MVYPRAGGQPRPLSQYEAKIRGLNVGLEVSVQFKRSAHHDGWNDPEHASGSLNWKIFQCSDPTDRNQLKRWWGLAVNNKNVLACSREERIAALNHITKLIAKLAEEAQARVDVIREAKNILNK